MNNNIKLRHDLKLLTDHYNVSIDNLKIITKYIKYCVPTLYLDNNVDLVNDLLLVISDKEKETKDVE